MFSLATKTTEVNQIKKGSLGAVISLGGKQIIV